MFWHVLSLVSACAYLVGIVCLAAGLSCSDRNNVSPCVAPHDRPAVPALCGYISGMVCVLASVLLLPSGTFPAFVEGERLMAWWLALFGGGCAGLAVADRTLTAQARWGLLATPLLLLVVYAVCIRYAYLRGFPGSLWNMESYVTMPLASGAGLWQIVGLGCLAAAVIRHAALLLPAGGRAFLLRACLRLAVAQFVVCLFFPLRLSGGAAASSTVALIADNLLYWFLVAVLLRLVFPLAARAGRHRWVSPVVAGAGLAFCLV